MSVSESDKLLLQKYPFAEQIICSAERMAIEIERLAKEIKNEFSSKVSEQDPLVVVGVMKGSFIFMADLCRALARENVHHIVEFLCLSSYGSASKSSGEVRMLLDLRHSIFQRHCLVVEDICDSGYTLQFLEKILSCRKPASLKFCVMLDKPMCHVVETPPLDFLMMNAPNAFLVGGGLDKGEMFRSLPDIVALKPEMYLPPAAIAEKNTKNQEQQAGVVENKEAPSRRERE